MRINKLFLFFIVFLFIASSVSAVTINHPYEGGIAAESIVYLDITTTLTNPTLCWYQVDGCHNKTLEGCNSEWIEIPFNDARTQIINPATETQNVNITVFEYNGSETVSDTVLFGHNNEFGEDGKGILVSSLIGFIFLLSFILWYPCFKLDSLHVPIKFGLTILGFFMPLVGLIASRSAIEQYIHSEALKSIFDSLIVGYTWLLYAIVSYFIIIFVIYIMALASDHKKNKEAMI